MPIPEKNVELPQPPATGSSPWVGSNGLPANPNSPAGGGGPGFFSSGIAGMSGNDSNPIPHPDSPVGDGKTVGQWDVDRLHEGGVALDTNVKITENKRKVNPPPVTVAGTTINNLRNNSLEEIVVTVVVVADGVFKGNDDGAALNPTTSNTNIVYCEIEPDKAEVEQPDGSKKLPTDAKVKKITGKMMFKPTVQLQIQYGKNVSATVPSAYGRGTTKEDWDAFDTSLGFHEAKHLDDARAFYKDIKHLPPVFAGKVGDTVTSFQAKQEAWAEWWTAYFKKDGDLSRAKTDDVGRTLDDGTVTDLATYKTKHPGYDH